VPEPFRVGITHDFLKPDGSLGFGDIGLDLLAENSNIQYEFLPDNGIELPASVANQFDSLLVLAPRVTAATLAGGQRLTLVARFGVGYDNVNVPACTQSDVLLTITPSGVRRPVAVSALALLLALAHKLPAKDRLTREGRWSEKLQHMGVGLTGRTLGLIGLGNIGREIMRIAAPLEMRCVTFDPHVPADVARGPIIDQRALTAALQQRRLAGAALDVFEKEPIEADDPLLALDNVILSPHAICWTDELFRGNGQAACRSILEVASGRVPQDVVNRDVLMQEGLRRKLARFAAQTG
jgi:D-3-phosphoglycerate dehydrogenase